MSDSLKVSAEKLLHTAEKFESEARAVQASTGEMMEQAVQLAAIWKGGAAEMYVTRLKALDADIRTMLDMIREESRKLQEMAEIYDRTEAQNREEAGALTGTVFV